MRALDGASLTLDAGAVHGVLGENGAGKSTLLGVLGGIVAPDAGFVEIRGVPGAPRSPVQARERGIGFVHQHFRLVGRMTVLENLALASCAGRFLSPFREVESRATALLEETGWRLPLSARVDHLSVGHRQRTEIVKALLSRPKILILDEPTAVLAPPEIPPFFALLRKLAARGLAVAFVGHKLDEVTAVADRVTVLGRGRNVLELGPGDDIRSELLATAIMGERRELSPSGTVGSAGPGSTAQTPGSSAGPGHPRSTTGREPGSVVARCRKATLRGGDGVGVDAVSFDVRRGEIVGVVGIEGNGQRELAQLMAGRSRPESGTLELPESCGFIPQDRDREGIAGEFDLTENFALAAQRRSGFRLDWQELRRRTRTAIREFGVRAPSETVLGKSLSGGNQQRLVVARELGHARDLLVAANPTRGLDLRATRFVHDAVRGIVTGPSPPGVLLVTSDLDEAMALSRRIYVMVRGELIGASRNRDEIGRLMLSG